MNIKATAISGQCFIGIIRISNLKDGIAGLGLITPFPCKENTRPVVPVLQCLFVGCRPPPDSSRTHRYNSFPPTLF